MNNIYLSQLAMAVPFQYDNFVQSQIAMGSGSQFGSGVRHYEDQGPTRIEVSGHQNKLSLKQKINEVLGLCREENEGINSQFQQVMGAEREIFDLMKEELAQPPRFNNYAHSNVQMFPGNSQLRTFANGQSQHSRDARGNQTFPDNGPQNYDTKQPNQPSYGLQQPQAPSYPLDEPSATGYPSSNPHIQNLNHGYVSSEKANILKSKVQ
jgi:hypothetical protein